MTAREWTQTPMEISSDNMHGIRFTRSSEQSNFCASMNFLQQEKSIFPIEVVNEVPEGINWLTVYGLISINKKIKRADLFQLIL